MKKIYIIAIAGFICGAVLALVALGCAPKESALATATLCGLPDAGAPDAGQPLDAGQSCQRAATYVQSAAQDSWGTVSSVSAQLSAPVSAGDLLVLAIGWYAHQTRIISAVHDTAGSLYARAIGPSRSPQFTQYLYFATAATAGSPTITAEFDGPVEYADMRVLDYANIAPVLGAVAAANGVSVTGSVALASQLGALVVFAGATEHKFVAVSQPSTTRLITAHDYDLAADRPGAAGATTVTASNNVSAEWLLQAVSFTGAGCAVQSYATTFDAAEDPLSESGRWNNVGIDWTRVKTVNGLAVGTQSGVQGFDDSYARLSSFPPNQAATGVVHLGAGLVNHHEVELLLRWSDSAHSAAGYECNLAFDGSYATIVRWNGAFGNFTTLATAGGLVVAEGSTLRAEARGPQIRLLLNGNLVISATDTTYATGQPGLGFFRNAPPVVDGDFAFTSYSAEAL